jgi:separase
MIYPCAHSAGGRAKVSCSSSSPLKTQPQDTRQVEQTASDAADVLRSMPALLQSLRLCWQLPLAAVHACRQLVHASVMLGLPYAATMFLHLGHGMSYAQQQALQRKWRLHAANAAAQPSEAPAERDEDEEAADTAAAEQGSGLRTGVHEAALAVLMGLDFGGDTGCAESLASLESGAKAWLLRALDVLPIDAVVSAVVQDEEGKDSTLEVYTPCYWVPDEGIIPSIVYVATA